MLSYEQPSKYIVTDTEYSDNKDLTPVLTANKAFILGYTKEREGVYKKGQCIILDDFTLDSKMVNFPFKVKSSAIKILTAKTSVNLWYKQVGICETYTVTGYQNHSECPMQTGYFT